MPLWQQDNFLNQRSDYLKFSCVSFDIFDTILFRYFRRYVDLFEVVCIQAKSKGMLPNTLHPDMFMEIRLKSESLARSKKYKSEKHREVTIYEIYEQMPAHFGDLSKVLELEIQLEIANTFLNPSVCSLIEYLHENNVPIVLASDMYLSKKVILEILQNLNFPIDYIKNIYVSCELCKSKSDGFLYDIILEENGLQASELLHIGDNYSADVCKAGEKGIQALHYDVIPSKMNYDPLEREELVYGKPLLPELNSIRRLSASLSPENDFWFAFGASFLGPILSLSVQWVIEVAVDNNIKNVYPFMREGKIFTSLLKQSIENDKLDINVEPLYVSRASTFLPSLVEVNADFIERFLRTQGIKVRDVFEMLELKMLDAENPFKDVWETSFKELGKTNIMQKNKIIDFLFSDSIKSQIIKNSEAKRKLLLSYLEKFDFKIPFITFDIGYAGTISEYFDAVVKNGKHLLTFGRSGITDKMMKGVNIGTFCGSEPLKGFFSVALILEHLIMCEEGSTRGYGVESGVVVPILEDNILPPEQIRHILACQKGAALFHKLFLTLPLQKRQSILNRRNEIPFILKRLYNLPTLEEARFFGELVNDDNFGSSSVRKIISEDTILHIQSIGIENFLNATNFDDNVLWPKGCVTLIEPDYFMKQAILESNGIGYERAILQLAARIKADKQNQVLLYGAGEAGRRFLCILKMCGIQVLAMVDKNRFLQGSIMDGVMVYSLDDALALFPDNPFVIGSFAHIYSILDTIKEAVGKDIEVYF